MSDSKAIKATHEGILTLGDVKIRVAVLKDRTRVLSQRGFLRALGKSEKARGRKLIEKPVENGADTLPAFLDVKSLNPFVSEHLTVPTKPIEFQPLHGGRTAYGYKAELLQEVCDIFLAARADGALPFDHAIAKQCEILLRGFARVGITALIDEVTGFQRIRDQEALITILNKYLKDKWSTWTKRFPEEYYRQLFRLHRIPYPPTTRNKPQYVGHWTNDIVYKRLTPGLLKKLRELNPKTESGERQHRHHQFFTEDYGVPELKEYLKNLVFLMQGCPDGGWEDFKRHLQRAAPKHGDQLSLSLEKDDEPKA